MKMKVKFKKSFLDRLFDPVIRCLTPQAAQALVDLRSDAKTQNRLDELADKNTEGLLTPEERAEYQMYVDAIDFISIMQAKARARLASTKAG